MRTRMIVVVAIAMMVPTMAVSAQTQVDFGDLSRQAAASQWRMIDPDSPTPWGDHSNPIFLKQQTTTCLTGGLEDTTSYGTPPSIDLGPIQWRQSCFTKGSLDNGSASGPIPMDLIPNMNQFPAFTYTFDGLSASDLAPTGSDVMIFTFDLPGNVLDPAYCSGANTQLALGYDNGGPTWSVNAAFPNDYFGGAGHITTLDIADCQLTATDYVVGQDGGLMPYPGNTLAAIGENSAGGSIISGMTRIPDGVTSYRPTIFHTDQSGNFDAGIVGHVWPSGGMYLSFADVICLVDVPLTTTTTTVVATTTSTTVAETTSTTVTATTSAPASTDQATTTTAVATGPVDVDDGGLPFIFILLLIFIILFLIWWFFFRSRVGGPVPPSGPQGPSDPGDPETPGGSIPPELHEEPHECDWALYLLTGSNRERIRDPKPGAHECCVYEVSVTSFVDDAQEVAKERQDLAEEGRERASVGRFLVSGLDADVRAGVRSWPYGEQGAMHGLGDMSEWPIVGPTPGPWPEYWQERQFEEQLDAAYTVRLDQQTRVKVSFTDGCAGSKHTYKHDAESTAVVQGTFECTNENTDPTCPIELTVGAITRVTGKGDLGYVVDAISHSDVDELPVRIAITGVNAEFRRADADGHRHDADRDRDVWEIRDGGGDDGVKNGDDWEGIIVNHIEADAGLMIPQAMWPTTDRVTGYLETDTSSEVQLSGEAVTGHSPKSMCCPHDGVVCLCAPSFNLKVGPGNAGKLTVDGAVRNLSNSDPMSTTQTIFWD